MMEAIKKLGTLFMAIRMTAGDTSNFLGACRCSQSTKFLFINFLTCWTKRKAKFESHIGTSGIDSETKISSWKYVWGPPSFFFCLFQGAFISFHDRVELCLVADAKGKKLKLEKEWRECANGQMDLNLNYYFINSSGCIHVTSGRMSQFLNSFTDC